MVEHSAVNRVVVGSSPTRGAEPQTFCLWFFIFKNRKSRYKLFPLPRLDFCELNNFFTVYVRELFKIIQQFFFVSI